MNNMKAIIFLSILFFGFLILKPNTLLGNVPADFESDCDVDFHDFAVLASAWFTQNGEPNNNSKCDISDPNDGVIDENDLAVFASFWLTKHPCDMAYIPAGTFQMGDSKNEGYSDEKPIHTVTLDSFYMGKYEITNQQYCDFLNSALVQGLITVISNVVYKSDSGESYPYCDTYQSSTYSQINWNGSVFRVHTKSGRSMINDPMVRVSWYGAAAYCNWRSQQEGYEQCYNLSTWECDFNKHGYRLATEAEWEYAARGGLSGNRFPWGDDIYHTQTNYYSSTSYTYDKGPYEGYNPVWGVGSMPYTSPVGFFDGSMKYKADYQWPASATSYQTTSGANNYGLYDIAGNVEEWCNDWYGSTYYSSSPTFNPTGPTSGTNRVLRIGCWIFVAGNCRVAGRSGGDPVGRSFFSGFRVVLDFQ